MPVRGPVLVVLVFMNRILYVLLMSSTNVVSLASVSAQLELNRGVNFFELCAHLGRALAFYLDGLSIVGICVRRCEVLRCVGVDV